MGTDRSFCYKFGRLPKHSNLLGTSVLMLLTTGARQLKTTKKLRRDTLLSFDLSTGNRHFSQQSTVHVL